MYKHFFLEKLTTLPKNRKRSLAPPCSAGRPKKARKWVSSRVIISDSVHILADHKLTITTLLPLQQSVNDTSNTHCNLQSQSL